MPAPGIVETPEEAAALELEPLLILRPLQAYLDDAGLGSGPVRARPIGEGHSNVTFEIRRGEQAWVLRRPPRGPLPPSAHDVLREHRLLCALSGTPARVPRVVCACPDPSVIGAPFYVMELVEGEIVATAMPRALDTPADRARAADELVDALVEIHAVDWLARGLEAFGKPAGYLDRQLRRFGGLWEHSKTRDVPELDRVGEWLAAHIPTSGPATIVHGDYRLGNVMFGPRSPARVVAVFDWELATIGDPLADVGYLTATYTQHGDPPTVLELSGATRRPGFPDRAALIDRYEERSGRSMSAVPWYQALALWKSAVFLEGSYARRLAGTTDDPFFEMLDRGVPELARRALAIAGA